MATARRNFNEADDAPAAPAKPQRPSTACAANGCPMPGAISQGRDGICSWHQGRDPHDWPRVTRALNDWHLLVREINLFRTLAAVGMNGTRMAEEYPKAVARLQDAYGMDNHFADVVPLPDERYEKWILRLSMLLNEAVRRNLEGRA